MASSLGAGGPGIAGVASTAPRRANLEFPPPPPYPPPHALAPQMAMDVANGSHSMHQQQPPNQRSIQDYSYAYYEPGPSRLHPSYPIEVTTPINHPSTSLQRPPTSQCPEIGTKRHTYVTRYGTEENIYEEISEIR